MYRGPFVYRRSTGSGTSSLTLESAAFGGGRLTPSGAMLYVTDYLGSVRAVVNGSTGAIYKASDFSAFGAESDVASVQKISAPFGTTFRDAYTGKEDQTLDFGTNYTDFGARQYSPALRRWMAPDPLSEKYYGISPYAFCADNPVNIIDADGEVIGFVMDVISVGCGVYNLAKNLQSGDTKAAWGDVAGIGLDLECAVIPGVTINAGTAKTLAKASAKIADRVVDAKGAWNLNPFDRGKSLEATLKGWGNNFPVIDKFDKTSRTITSIKSLDLNAKSYQSGNAVFNRVKGYIDKLVDFKGGRLGDKDIKNVDFDNRVLELAIPERATDSQLEQLRRLQEYAQEQNIQLTIVLAK